MLKNLMRGNALCVRACDFWNQILPSPEQKALQTAMNTDFRYGEYEAYLPYARGVIAAYTTKGAEGIRSHPTASTQSNLKLLDMVEASITAQFALDVSDDVEFMKQFDKILAMAPVNEASFNNDMAIAIAGDLAGIQDPNGPPTVIQTKAMQKLSQHAILNANIMKPRDGHSLGSGTRLAAGMRTQESARKGIERHKLSTNATLLALTN